MYNKFKSLLILGAMLPMCTYAQLNVVQQEPANLENEPVAVHPVPHPRQIKWQETEFYAFFHYGMNTYTGNEWGKGDEAESLFAPSQKPNPKQWLQVAKAAGMNGGIAVVKHHDGFCLWPTETTSHSVKGAGTAYGRETNIPKDFAAAAKELKMKYGFYVSPWDMNSAYYGTDTYVKDVFLRQCNELAQYGRDQFEMWFDGANGGTGYYGGKYGKVEVDRSTYYDTPNLRDTVHAVCPDCVLWGVGGEARWIGNEEGWAGETNWSPENRDYASEKNGMYGTENGWFWLPGESDAKATDKGWFWHSNERALSAEELFTMYLKTVGRNSTLILNLPPNKEGIIPPATEYSLTGLGKLLKERLGNDLALTAKATAQEVRKSGQTRTYVASNVNDDNKKTYWATNDNVTSASITLMWEQLQKVHYVELMEYIAKGQRVRKFKIETTTDGSTWTPSATNIPTTTIGYKRIIPLNSSVTTYGPGYNVKGIRVTIEDSRACPLISKIGVY